MEFIENLWPSSIFDTQSSSDETPRQILLQQATYFSERKRNLLQGEIRSSQGSLKNEHSFVHEFIIKAPTLGSFHFTLLRVAHGYFDFYPVKVYNALKEVELEANDEAEFKKVLREIFNDSKTISAVKVLEDSLSFKEEF